MSGYASDLAFVEYGVGEELSSVLMNLKEAVHAFIKVFELRGTAPTLPVVHIGGAQVRETTRVDYSLTNSQRGLMAMYLPLICQLADEARKIAALIGDPEGATYIGENSDVCTPEDQDLACSLKALLLDETYGMGRQSQPSSEGRAYERMMLESIWVPDQDTFLEGVRRLLVWHAREHQHTEHRRDPAWLICVPGLALSTLARSRGLIQLGQLPDNNPYLPVALIGQHD